MTVDTWPESFKWELWHGQRGAVRSYRQYSSANTRQFFTVARNVSRRHFHTVFYVYDRAGRLSGRYYDGRYLRQEVSK